MNSWNDTNAVIDAVIMLKPKKEMNQDQPSGSILGVGRDQCLVLGIPLPAHEGGQLIVRLTFHNHPFRDENRLGILVKQFRLFRTDEGKGGCRGKERIRTQDLSSHVIETCRGSVGIRRD